jgi:hypothetical protein
VHCSEAEIEIVILVEPQKWLTQLKTLLTDICSLLRTSSGEWTDLQISSQFTERHIQKKLIDIANRSGIISV